MSIQARTALLSTAYFGNIQYFSKLATGSAIIEAHENFQKQTYRNRAAVMTAAGIQTLTVPVVWDHHCKMPLRGVRIDYTLPWRRNHLRTLQTAYAAAPYFDHYIGEVEHLIAKRYEFLWDLNCDTTQTMLRLLKLDVPLRFTDDYVSDTTGFEDFRDSISPKASRRTVDDNFSAPRYYQLFEDRVPFAPNLSILDLLFCEGQML